MSARPAGARRREGREAFLLDPIRSKKKRKRFCTIDIESKDGDEARRPGFTRPFLVGMYDPKNDAYHEFRDEPHLRDRDWRTRHIQPGGCVDKMLWFVLQKELNGCVFYSHAGGSFDELFFLPWLRSHREEYGFEVIPVQSTIQMIRVWRWPDEKDGPIEETWEFLDSMRLVPMSLDRACTSFLPKSERERKGKIKVDLAMHEDDPRWSTYLRMDCVSLAYVMDRLETMVHELGGELGITTPATAMKLFRREYMGRDGVPERIQRFKHWPWCREARSGCRGCQHDWIRLGYYGGRTEIHEFFGENVRYYDLNSSYVFAMRSPMPIGDRRIDEGELDLRRHPSRGGKFGGFCECTVFIPPECKVPPLPHRDRRTGKLVFPTGRFTGVWSVEELLLLDDPLVGGRIESVVRTVWFRLQPMFGPMVDELWKLRNKKNPKNVHAPCSGEGCPECYGTGVNEDYEGLSQLAKLLGNSTYGKFAMKQDRSSVVFRADRVEDPTGRDEVGLDCCFLCREQIPEEDEVRRAAGICPGCEGSKCAMPDDDGDVWYQKHQVDAAYIIPHVAAHITALARVRLWKAMKMVVVLGGKILYADTDSVLTNIRLPKLDEVREVEARHPGLEVVPVSPQLGDLKDEYPGEDLRFTAVQPKVYMIELMRLNASVELRQQILASARAGEDVFDASTLDGTVARRSDGPAPDDQAAQDVLREARGGSDLVDASALGRVDVLNRTYALEPYAKITMKGFPGQAHQRHVGEDGDEQWVMRPIRTRENLERLMVGETIRWRRLEKVRSMAQKGFRKPPAMTDVSKSFKTEYDKRIRMPDGTTRPIVLREDLDAEPSEDEPLRF